MGTTYGPSQDASKSGRKLDSENGATKYGPPRKKVGFGKWAKGKGSKKFKERRSLEHPLLFLHLRKAGGSHICSMAREAHEKTIDSIEECNCNWVGHDWHPSEGRPDTAASCELRRSVFQQMHATFGMIPREFRQVPRLCLCDSSAGAGGEDEFGKDLLRSKRGEKWRARQVQDVVSDGPPDKRQKGLQGIQTDSDEL